MDAMRALERQVSVHAYTGERPSVEDVKHRADLVMDIHARMLEIEADARDRAASRRLATANGWLPIGLKVLAALCIGALVASVLIGLDGDDRHRLVNWIVAHAATPLYATAGLGGASVIVRGALKGISATQVRDAERSAHTRDESDPAAPR
jgi:hypothetical protein